ncbi:MAG: HAD hydrolase family protein, partial [Clostridia bacterium]|nr:HAD hydrolase family protein [Clostridia bacterium]
IVKIAIWDKNGNAEPLGFLPKSLRVAYNVGEWCEYTSAISNKGLAVSDLQMRLYLTKFDTCAIGDGVNDIEMMKKAKVAVSANGAGQELRSVCNRHTDNVAEFLGSMCEE